MNTVIHVRWPTGQAEIDLTAWFPAPVQRVTHLRKLLALNPAAAEQARPIAERVIHDLRCQAKGQYEKAIASVDRWRKAAACCEDKKEAARLRYYADHDARIARMAQKDERMLRKNAAAVKAWRF